MATTAAITIASDIYSGFSGITKTMTLTKAGTTNDLEETTGFSRVKLSGTTATDFIRMATELVDTTATTTGAKVYVKNIGDGKPGSTPPKDKYVTIQIGNIGTAVQEVGRLYGDDWMVFPVTTADDVDVIAIAQDDNVVVLEYVMFYE